MGAVAPPALVPAAGERRRWTRDNVRDVGVRVVKVAGIVFTAWLCTVLFLIVIYRFINPPFSALMALRWVTGTKIEQDWVPLEPHLAEPAARRDRLRGRALLQPLGHRLRGGCGGDQAHVERRAARCQHHHHAGGEELVPLAGQELRAQSHRGAAHLCDRDVVAEAAHPGGLSQHRRMGARHLRGRGGVAGAFRPVRRPLGARQSAQLAVSLPNPVCAGCRRPGAWTSRRASVIQRRALSMRSASSCVDTAR